MQAASIEAIACPKQAVNLCLELLLRELPDAQRQERIAACKSTTPPGLFAAINDQTVVGAIWAEPFAGRTASVWSPQLAQGTSMAVAETLAAAATVYLRDSGCQFAQALAPTSSAREARLFLRHGFVFVANLLYLTAPTQHPRTEIRKPKNLTFAPYHPLQLDRLVDLIEQTYLGTLDCPRLNRVRDLHDVISGYRATGCHDPTRWFFVRNGSFDVGVLLLARHRQLGHCELMYMGLVPAARRQGHGQEIVEQALATATKDGDHQLVLAVDQANLPAIATYERAGFTEWDRRSVLAWFPHSDVDKRLNFTETCKS